MIFRLFRPTPSDHRIASLYGMIVAQARAEAFYRDFGVPDTVSGRFEMVVLHLVLLLRRLEREPDGSDLGQGLFDQFCSDMDANLREIGIGDLKVPQEMRRMGEAFYGRKAAYEAALATPGAPGLAATLARNIYGTAAETAAAQRLAAYALDAVDRLAALDAAALGQGQARFPDPAGPGIMRAGGPT